VIYSTSFFFFLLSYSSHLLPRRRRMYDLEIVQHPEVSAEFGSAALSRLPLAPPPIARLIIRGNRDHVIEP
jgi:hypothetical protein